MTKYTMADGQNGSVVLAGINGNFDELYRILADGIIAGKYLAAMPYATLNAGAAPGTANMYICPIVIRKTATLSAIATYVTTAHAANTFGLAVYAHNYTTGQPTGTPIAQTATTLSTATATAVDGPLVANVQLNPGIYWVAFQTTSASAVWQCPGSTSGVFLSYFGDGTLSNVVSGAQAVTVGYQIANTYASWPDLTTPPAYGFIQSARMPALYLKYASVP